MYFRMPRIDEESLEDALRRVEQEIPTEAERLNFRKVIKAMYEQKSQTPTIPEGGE
jgi:hypothetical protein